MAQNLLVSTVYIFSRELPSDSSLFRLEAWFWCWCSIRKMDWQHLVSREQLHILLSENSWFTWAFTNKVIQGLVKVAAPWFSLKYGSASMLLSCFIENVCVWEHGVYMRPAPGISVKKSSRNLNKLYTLQALQYWGQHTVMIWVQHGPAIHEYSCAWCNRIQLFLLSLVCHCVEVACSVGLCVESAYGLGVTVYHT